MSAETYLVAKSARELKALGTLHCIAERRRDEIDGLVTAQSGTVVPLYGESGQSGVTVFIPGPEDTPPATLHKNHAVMLFGVKGETAVVTSGGQLAGPKEKVIGRAVVVGELQGEDLCSTTGDPVKRQLLNPGEHMTIPPDRPYKIHTINGGSSTVLGLKYRMTKNNLC